MDYAELKKLMSKQKDEMTAAERMKAYNAGEEVIIFLILCRRRIRRWRISLALQRHSSQKILK